MKIAGLMKLTLLDFPGHVACTVFLAGCNFRCPFCHNGSLVRGGDIEISREELFAFLKKRQGVLDGVCVTGGEPLMNPDIAELVRGIKELGFLVKLDTNGFYPHKLKELLDLKLIDYVAMDIKNSKEKYSLICGTDVDTAKISKSISLLINGNIPYEFRTTVVKEFHTPQDIEDMSRWIVGAGRYFLQSFKDSGDIISDGLSAYTPEEMRSLLDIARKNIPSTELRGI